MTVCYTETMRNSSKSVCELKGSTWYNISPILNANRGWRECRRDHQNWLIHMSLVAMVTLHSFDHPATHIKGR